MGFGAFAMNTSIKSNALMRSKRTHYTEVVERFSGPVNKRIEFNKGSVQMVRHFRDKTIEENKKRDRIILVVFLMMFTILTTTFFYLLTT